MASRVAIALIALAAFAAAYDPTKPYQIPQQYVAEVEFRIPYDYVKLVEPFKVYTDHANQRQRLSFYGGADVYINRFDASSGNSTQWTIFPVQFQLECGVSTFQGGQPLTNVFPDLSLFTKQNYQQSITTNAHPSGILCDVWKYHYGVLVNDPADNDTSTFEAPDSKGYAGDYFFYVSATDGTPVQFRSDVGHNAVLGGSHTDLYLVDYLWVNSVAMFDDDDFVPPAGMPCQPSSSPFGPTYWHGDGRADLHPNAVRSNAFEDIASLFPGARQTKIHEDRFQDYLDAHGKEYDSEAEYEKRKLVFHHHLRYINAANRRGKTFHLAANHLADWTKEERLVLNGYVPVKNPKGLKDYYNMCGLYNKTSTNLPSEVDWTTECPPGAPSNCKALVNPPKDQGTCGSCWTFGTTGAVEAAQALKHGTLPMLSEQSIIDCAWLVDTNYSNQGCGGGNDFTAYGWLLINNDGKVADSSYGNYMNQNGFCHFDFGVNPPVSSDNHGNQVNTGATIASCTHVTDCWESQTDICPTPADVMTNTLSTALSEGHVLSVAIDATETDFYFYHSGYYYSANCKSGNQDLDHQVLAVGYTTWNGQRYTRIRNSWSDHWGEKGYVWISQEGNSCGVATQPTFVTVA